MECCPSEGKSRTCKYLLSYLTILGSYAFVCIRVLDTNGDFSLYCEMTDLAGKWT